MKIKQNNRRFVNVYEITKYNAPTSNNDVKVIGCFEAKDYKEAKEALNIIKNDPQFNDSKFSVQIDDFNAVKVSKLSIL